MSDHDTPDPMDRAYAQAEAILGDEAARAARRARVLAAVAREAATPPAHSSPAIKRPAWRSGRWLVAASVAGLGVFLATQVYLPTLNPPQVAPAAPVVRAPAASVVPAPKVPEVTLPPTPAAQTPTPAAKTPAPKAAPRTAAAAPSAAKPSPSDLAAVAPSPPREIAEARRTSPAPPPAASRLDAARAPATGPAAAPNEINDLVVTAEKRVSVGPSVGSPAERAQRLRDAAAAGRTAEVAALLAKGVPVDAPDASGETALMKAIQADQPAAAALLRRHGASLDRKNHAGDSARDMARAIGNAELNQAIGLGP